MKYLNEKTIGIIGGAGPMASCVLNQYLVDICQRQFACTEDQDFPLIINYSYPFGPMIEAAQAQANSERILKELAFCIAELSKDRSLVHRHCL